MSAGLQTKQGGAHCSHDRSQTRLVIVASPTPDVGPVVSPIERILLPLIHRVLQNGHNICGLFSSGSGDGDGDGNGNDNGRRGCREGRLSLTLVSGEEERLKRVVRAKPFVDEAVGVYLGTLEVLVAACIVSG